MRWLGWLNFLVLQWLCIRLVEVVERRGGTHVSYGVLFFVAPLTGWWGAYWPRRFYVRRFEG